MTFYLTVGESGSMDALLLREIKGLGEGSEEYYLGMWMLYSILARRAAMNAEAMRRTTGDGK